MKRFLFSYNPLLTSMRTGLGSAPFTSGIVSIPPVWCLWGIMLPGYCMISKSHRSDCDDTSNHFLSSLVYSFKHLYCITWPSYWYMLSYVTEIRFYSRKLISWRINYNINRLLCDENVTTLPSCGSSMIGINHYISHLLVNHHF